MLATAMSLAQKYGSPFPSAKKKVVEIRLTEGKQISPKKIRRKIKQISKVIRSN